MSPTPAEIAFAHTVEENNRMRYLARRDAARRRAGRSTAGSGPIDKPACIPAGSSLPSGEAVDWRITALALAASVIVLPIALVGYIGISVAIEGWRRIRRG